jgi:uncharacterized protein (DUF3820 family)
MEYLVFPFGKYKGVQLKDLPSTYIVLALEKFDLPEELTIELTFIIRGRLKIYSGILRYLENYTIDELVENIIEKIEAYESEN